MANAVETPSQNNLMTEGSIVKSLLLFALPLIFGNLLQQLYNTADSIIVGNFVGANALAAVGSSGSPSICSSASARAWPWARAWWCRSSWGQGPPGSPGGRAHLAGHRRDYGPAAHCGRHRLRPGPAGGHEHPRRGAGDAVTYIRIYFGGVLFSVVYNMTAGILNAAGNSRRSLIYLAWASVTNIVLDLVFIVIFRMGVAGAAIATDISQLVSCVLSLRFLIKSTDDCRVIPARSACTKRWPPASSGWACPPASRTWSSPFPTCWCRPA